MNKDWNDDKKIAARAFFLDRFPFGPCANQYWSMAGLCDKPGCEVDQAVRSGLVTFDKFHGVEIDTDTHLASKAAYPEAHWHRGDFYNVMAAAKAGGRFRPSIVNADLTWMADKGAPYIAKIMSLLSDYEDVMLVANFVLKSRRHAKQDIQYVWNCLRLQTLFAQAMRNGWQFDPDDCWEYDGTGEQSKTVMGTFVFLRPAKLALAA